MQGDLTADSTRCGLRRVEDPLVAFTLAGAGPAQVVEADGPTQDTVQLTGLHRQAAAVELHFGPALSPEHAVAGQQLAVFRFDMQFDIKGIRARAHQDHFTHFEFTIQHHRARLHVRQGVGHQRQGGGRQIAQAVFQGFIEVGIQRIAVAHGTFLTRQDTDPAADPLAGAGCQELDAIEPDFHVYPAVNHEFTVAMHQLAVLRINRHRKGDAFAG